MSTTLLADIGGSKSRFAIANSSGAVEHVLVIHNDTAADLDAAVSRYLEETGARHVVTRAERLDFWLNLLGIIAAILNAFVHSRDAYAMVPQNVILSVITVLILPVTGWLGWAMVYRYGVGASR